MPQPINSPTAVSWDDLPTFSPIFQVSLSFLTDVHWPEQCCFGYLFIFSCFRQEGKSIPCYSILTESKNPSFFNFLIKELIYNNFQIKQFTVCKIFMIQSACFKTVIFFIHINQSKTYPLFNFCLKCYFTFPAARRFFLLWFAFTLFTLSISLTPPTRVWTIRKEVLNSYCLHLPHWHTQYIAVTSFSRGKM